MDREISNEEFREAVREGFLSSCNFDAGPSDAGLFEVTERDVIRNIERAESLDFDLLVPLADGGRVVHCLIPSNELVFLFDDDPVLMYTRIVYEVLRLIREQRGSGTLRPAVDLNRFVVADWHGVIPWVFELYDEVDWVGFGEEQNAR
jgi:hypothetical protein